MRHAFNHIINIIWTVIAFLPVMKYWYGNGISTWFIIITSLSVAAAFFPKKFYDLFQLSTNRGLYEKLGVKRIRQFVQNGDIAKKIPDKTGDAIINDATNARKYLLTIEMYSRFHWVCLWFFLFSTIHAVFTNQVLIALLMFIANMLYNGTAILLQQYNRLRIEKLLKTLELMGQ